MDLKELGWGGRIGFIWFRIETGAGSYEHGNEPAGFIECWEIHE
jgi:hypothetical protein